VDITTFSGSTRPTLAAGVLVGSFGLRTAMARVGLPAGGGSFSASLTGSTFDGWRDHSGQSKGQLTLSLRTPVGEKSRLALLLAATSNLMKFPGPLTREQMDIDPSQADSTYRVRDERRFNRIGRFAARWEQDMAEGHTIMVQGFVEPKVLQRSERNRFRDFNRYHLGAGGTYRLSAGLADDVRSVTLAGVDAAYQDGTILFYTLAGGNRGTSLVANKEEGASTLGAFLQEEVQCGERLTLTAGGRLDRLTYASDDFITPGLAATKTFTALTPAFGISYRWSPVHSVYASFGGGVEAPAFNEIDPPPPFDERTSLNPFLEPMTSRTVEVGARGVAARLIGSLLVHYDVAAYAITVKNEIVPYDGGAYFLSAGKSRRVGLEISALLESPAGFSGGCAVTISRNRYLEYRNELGDFGENSVAGLPGFYASAMVRYRHERGLYAEVGVRTVGSYYADDANTPGGRVGSSAVFDATVGGSFALSSAIWDAYLTVENCADTRYTASAFINGVAAPNRATPRYFEPGLPRNLLAGLRLRLPGGE
jgi:iron complex outermembrane receptor protein